VPIKTTVYTRVGEVRPTDDIWMLRVNILVILSGERQLSFENMKVGWN